MLESLKNQDGYGSRAFRCCWTRQTCSLLKTDLRGLPGAVASITWLARLVRGGLWSYPPGLVLIAQLLSSSVLAVLDGNRGPVRRMSCRVIFPGTKEISKLLLTASA